MNKGFTLIELLVTSTITIVLGAAILGLQYFIGTSQISSINSYINVDRANSALSIMARDLRKMAPSESGAYPIESASDNEVIFYSDIDYDGDAEKVRYSLSGGDLVKGVIEPTGSPVTYPSENESFTTVTENIRNTTEPLFAYYNGNWPNDIANNPLPEYLRISDTRLIGIYVNLNENEELTRQEYILESTVALRSLKDNY